MIVCKYKFDKSIYENLIPIFNDGYNGYTVTDEIDSENSNHIIRTIECDTLPTLMRFGIIDTIPNTTNREISLIEILDMNISALTTYRSMFRGCKNVINISANNWNTSKVTNMANMFFNCSKLTSLDVSNWDTSNVINMQSMFWGCKNLTSLDLSNFDTSNVTNMSNMFAYCSNLTSLDVSNFNTGNVTSMQQMFFDCSNLTSLDVGNFDTSKVTDMNQMFRNCYRLTSLDVSRWNVSKVISMQNMFCDCQQLQAVDVSNWNTDSLVYGNVIFQSCHNIKSLDLSNWKNDNMTESFGIVSGCNLLNTINLNNFKLPNYNIMTLSSEIKVIYLNMIENLVGLLPNLHDRTGRSSGQIVTTLRNQIDEETMATLTTKNWEIVDIVAQYKFDANTYENLIPEFNTEFSSDKYEVNDSISEIVIDNIKWEEGALSTANGLVFNHNERIYTKNYFNVIPNVTYTFLNTTPNVFWYDSDKNFISYETVKKAVAPSNAKYLRLYIAKGYDEQISAKLITRSIESKNGDLPTLMRFGRIWVNGESATDNRTDSLLKVLDMNTNELTSCSSMFRYNTNLTSISCEWDTSNVNNMTCMFQNCNKLTQLDVSNFNTSNVTNMSYIFYNCNKLTQLDVSNFNTSNVTTMSTMFYNCNNLTSLDVSSFDTSKVTNMGYMFYRCSNLTSLNVSNWDTSKVEHMREMFYECNALSQINQTNLVTSALLSTNRMFYGCNKLTSLDVSNWNTSNVTDMGNMFVACYSLTGLDMSNWDTSKVTDMSWMFYNCNNLTSLDLSNFVTNNVTDMSVMFSGCTKLASLDVSNFNTNKVTNMSYMFQDCTNLTSLDVSNWDTSNVENMYRMFRECRALSNLDLSRWNPFASIGDLFVNANSLKSIRMSNFKQIKQGIYVWYSCDSLEYIDIDKMNITQVFEGMFEKSQSIKCIRCNVETSIPFIAEMILDRTNLEQGKIITNVEVSSETLATLQSKNWTVVSDSALTKVAEYVYDSNTWRSMIPTFNSEFIEYFIDDVEDENGLVTRTISSMGELPTKIRFGTPFSDSNYVEGNELALLEVLHLNVNTIIDATNMFKRCIYLTSVQSSDWNTGNMISMYAMFAYCESLSILDVSNWDTSQVTNMWGVFINCYKLTSLDVSNWDTSNVTSLWATFSGCNNLTSLDVSNWDTSKVTNMGRIFRYCSLLTPLDLSNWDTSNVENMVEMFYDCRVLTSLDVSNFDTSKVTDMNNIFKNTPKLTDIGMLYCTPSTINTIASNLLTTHTQTIWVQDADINKLTSVSGVEFKEYKENSYMINLSSPLLDGDRIEVVDGKLCHYHKMGMVVLDGSENWGYHKNSEWTYGIFKLEGYFNKENDISSATTITETPNLINDKFKLTSINHMVYKEINSITSWSSYEIVINIGLKITNGEAANQGYIDNFKQWLQANPTTVIYELTNPYYEDITPIQSSITLETFNECNMDIYTKLPIKTNVSYITNVPSLSTLSMRATEMKESDNIIANLTNMLDNEINE